MGVRRRAESAQRRRSARLPRRRIPSAPGYIHQARETFWTSSCQSVQLLSPQVPPPRTAPNAGPQDATEMPESAGNPDDSGSSSVVILDHIPPSVTIEPNSVR